MKTFVRKAVVKGIKAAVEIAGIVRVSAADFEGKLGPYDVRLKEALRV